MSWIKSEVRLRASVVDRPLNASGPGTRGLRDARLLIEFMIWRARASALRPILILSRRLPARITRRNLELNLPSRGPLTQRRQSRAQAPITRAIRRDLRSMVLGTSPIRRK